MFRALIGSALSAAVLACFASIAPANAAAVDFFLNGRVAVNGDGIPNPAASLELNPQPEPPGIVFSPSGRFNKVALNPQPLPPMPPQPDKFMRKAGHDQETYRKAGGEQVSSYQSGGHGHSTCNGILIGLRLADGSVRQARATGNPASGWCSFSVPLGPSPAGGAAKLEVSSAAHAFPSYAGKSSILIGLSHPAVR